MTASYDAVADLRDLLKSSGAVVTFDPRRYARAAREWPDCLPPMFPAAELEVAVWGMGYGAHWEPRAPNDWPATTLRVGDVVEFQPGPMTWEEVTTSFAPFYQDRPALFRRTVVRVAGEQWEAENRVCWPVAFSDNMRLVPREGP